MSKLSFRPMDMATGLWSTFVNKKDLFSFSIRQSIVQWSLLKRGQSNRDPVTSDSRLAMKVIAPFHSSFCCLHDVPHKPVIYFDSRLLLSHNILVFIFCAPINNRFKPAKIAVPSEPRLLSVPSSLHRIDPGTGPEISPVFPPFLCSDVVPSASSSSRSVRRDVVTVASHWCFKAGSLDFLQTADVTWPTEHYSARELVSDREAEVTRGHLQ
jgi:hypothetical protein